MPQLYIDHAGDCVRTIGGGRAVFKNLDTLDRRFRDRIEIDKALRAGAARPLRVGSNAPAIDQDQRVARIESPQRNGGSARREKVLAIKRWDTLRARHWEIPEALLGGAFTRFFDERPIDGLHRIGADLFRSRNVRAGHDDPLRFSFRARLIGRYSSGRRKLLRRWRGRLSLSRCDRQKENSEAKQSSL